MAFQDCFELDFLQFNHIELGEVIASNNNKTFVVPFVIDEVLPIVEFKKLLAGIAKMEKKLRRFDIEVTITYKNLCLDKKELYKDYFQVILATTGVDYELLSLSNYTPTYENGVYTIISEENKIKDIAIEKAVNRFKKYGFEVSFNITSVSKEEINDLKTEKIQQEMQVIETQIEESKAILEKQQKLEELARKPKKYNTEVSDHVDSILTIPTTQAGMDECINTKGSTFFTVQGEIFKIDIKELKMATLYSLYIYDGEDSIQVKKFVKTDVDKELFSTLKVGDVIRTSGNASYDTYAREVVITISKIKYIGEAKKLERTDTALEKRVELHAHTNMSALDALPDVSLYIKQAKKWGMKAIAITDHDGIYSFHDLWQGAKKAEIKPLYGVELGFVDEKKFNIAYTVEDIDLKDATYVVFDIETTGFSVNYDQIIQIGARKVRHGQVLEIFEEFINPERPIPKKITELTSITDEMVSDKDTIDKVLPRFIEFIGDSILVAQNASFDVGHIYYNMDKLGITIPRPFPVIDTMQLARNFFFNELKTFNLKSLSKFFKVQQEHHHLADDDTRVTTEIFLQMLQTLFKNNIYNYKDINGAINQDIAYKQIMPAHITMIAQTQDGYKNLFKVISDAMTEHFHQESRVLKSVLDNLRQGLLIGSACVNGEVFEKALNKSQEELEEAMAYYDYIEVQPPKIYADAIHRDEYDDVDYVAMCEDTIKRIIATAKKLGKIVVATGDCHYINKEDKEYRDIYISAPQLGGGIHPLMRCKKTPDQHFKATDEMLADFSFLGPDLAHEIVVTNTNKIADMVEDIVPFRDGKNDLYSPADEEFAKTLGVPSIKDDLIRLVYEHAHKNYGDPLPQFVQDRLDKELNSIVNNGYSPIYYMAYLLVHKSNSDGYVVGSRGSVGSSFVATMMGITEVNPLPPHYYCECGKFCAFKFTKEEKEKYPLSEEQLKLDEKLQKAASGYDLEDAYCPCCGAKLVKDGQDIPFETFLGFGGDKTPDIDLNFSGEYQPRAHEYVRTLMGPEHAFRAGTVTGVQENTAIGYVRGHLERKGLTKRSCEVARIAKHLEGVRRSTGQHPGGIVVVPSYKDIYDVTPIQYPADKTDNNWRTTHFEYHHFEANLLKLDILGHDDPTTLRFLFDYVEAHPEEFPFKTPQGIPLDDPEVYKMFNDTISIGLKHEDIDSPVATFAIPEFGTRFTRQMLIDTMPKNFAELVKISGLSHGTDVWANNCQELVLGRTEFGKIDFALLIGCRDDIMVQLIEYGVPFKESFDIMEFVRKGKLHKDPAGNAPKWAKYKELMRQHQVPEWYIWSCEQIKYMFPKAHAVAYVMSAMRIAWFKIHKPILFYSAFFTVRASQFEPDVMLAGINKINFRIKEIENMTKTTVKDEDLLTMYQVAREMLLRGMTFSQVDIQKSHATHFVIEGNSLRLPFIAVPGLGESVAIDIMQKREEKAFTSCDDVSKRTKLNKTLFEKMMQLGSFGDLPEKEEIDELGLFAL